MKIPRSPPQRKRRDFRSSDSWYDLTFDAVLIEQSIAKQYGLLPAQQGEISWQDWQKLVSGLMDDTPLGRVVAVRSEEDRERIQQFSPWQQQIRAEWAAFRANQMLETTTETDLRKQMAGLEKLLANAFGGGD